ncbi:MAG: ribose-phosphate diphosphokinase [Armatimonadetes bacterium]|nr:ribose-phosphate diphosphokinase [Armatimonadota bacterium]NIM23162.1 ribose-phosphate diphosphokinase [Armatimonadota bacterium]NIM67030.1 ribose-phosphate diphosphokinase [Armatimonadota bacterium]NIM75564.1 ribose-phosphate diphosphokinase [Armatimonadota bacterium]NIN05219.1 ribose-phosphate diphosphokinase [Armatimonadota bacterium]
MKDSIKVFSGNGNPHLARAICDYLDLPLGQVTISRFSNENIFIQIEENVRERDVFVVQPLCSPVSENLIELLLMLDSLRHASARRITAVIPYFSYARSDKKDMPRISIAGRLVADLLQSAGADRALTMSLHSDQVMGFFRIPIDQLNPIRIFCDYFRELGLEDTVALATDAGSARRAGAYAIRLNLPLAFIDKRRVSDEEVHARAVVGDVSGKTVIIFDDEICRGTSLLEAVKTVHDMEVREVRAAATHGVFANDALERIEALDPLKQVIVTDTVPRQPTKEGSKIRTLSVAGLFGEAIKRIHTGESVSGLFE